MKSFFTSSLDKIDIVEPYVNAMSWDSYRSQFRTPQSSKSGNRNCALASVSLNPDSPELSNAASRAIDFPLIVQNTSSQRFTIESQPETKVLSPLEVDACFGSEEIDFIDCIEGKQDSWVEASWLECSEAASQISYDEELGLMESVQEIALSLARTTPRRVALEKKEAN